MPNENVERYLSVFHSFESALKSFQMVQQNLAEIAKKLAEFKNTADPSSPDITDAAKTRVLNQGTEVVMRWGDVNDFKKEQHILASVDLSKLPTIETVNQAMQMLMRRAIEAKQAWESLAPEDRAGLAEPSSAK